MSRLACIDLGTNTFHFLIVDSHDGRFTEVYRKRIYVILAENGIQTIGQQPLHRAKSAILSFKSAIENYTSHKLKILGTEALRVASNGFIITQFIHQELGEQPEIISGAREAELILKGTQLVVNMTTDDYCIMDIGGGSVEFIATSNGDLKFLQSFKVGVTVLYNRFHKSEPILKSEIDDVFSFLHLELKPLIDYLNNSNGQITLIGASGSYEVLQSILEGEVSRTEISTFSLAEFYDLCDLIVNKNKNQRSQINGLPKERVNMIVVAFLLIKFVLDTGQFKHIIVSPYALKEGVLAEMISE